MERRRIFAGEEQAMATDVDGLGAPPLDAGVQVDIHASGVASGEASIGGGGHGKVRGAGGEDLKPSRRRAGVHGVRCAAVSPAAPEGYHRRMIHSFWAAAAAVARRPFGGALWLSLGVVALLVGPACTCGVPPATSEPGADAGEIALDGGVGGCANDDECALGERCVAGDCVPAVADVVDDGCLADTDCPAGSLCAQTTGRCIEDAATPGVPGGPPGPCVDGEDRTCGVKVGACDYGIERCEGARWSGVCLGAIGPTPEQCDGLDNDCDADTDEDFAVGAACADGQGVCARAGVTVCTADGLSSRCNATGLDPTGRVELCGNALDDDCDGTIDDGFAARGDACFVGTLPCRSEGQLECAADERSLVCALPPAGAELCNGGDDDGDTCVDEGFDLGSACAVGEGACRRTGVTVCRADGSGVVCSAAPAAPGVETCNGVDDDCNTVIDNGCDDDNDDFCDAALGFGGTPPLAVCPLSSSAAARDCDDGNAAVNPNATEICNDGRDQNCDGDPNDGCLACNAAIDADFDGSNQCDDCDETNGAIRPGAIERCNGFDDDCDGSIDEDSDGDRDGFTTCGTARPGGGLDPALVDCDDANAVVHPGPGSCELCANASGPVACGAANDRGTDVDEDCDGFVDETCFPCSTADPDNDGVSECGGDCAPSDPAVRPGTPEVCDGKDTDCNVFTVDNCDVGDACNRNLDGNAATPEPDECRDRLICVESLRAGGQRSGTFTCTSLCNTTSPGLGLGDSCDVDETCGSRLTPTANLHGCAVTTGFGAKAPGQTCGGDDECRSGICLRDGRFTGNVKYCTDFCGSDAYCPSGTTCQASSAGQSGQCLRVHPAQTLSPGANCTSTTGISCVNGSASCVDLGGGAPGCDAGDSCRCEDICCTNADCRDGEYCSLRGDTVPGPAGGVDTVPVCFPETPTNGGRPAGAACDTSAHCASEFCDVILGVCVDTCCNDSTCPTGLSCESEVVTLPSGSQTIARVCVSSTPADPLEAR